MAAPNEINWGPIDAALPDDQFAAKYVVTIELEESLLNEKPMVSGEKGSGKTALCRYFARNKSFDAVASISFNNIAFARIVKDLKAIAELSGLPRLGILTNYWKYIIWTSAMTAYCKNTDYHEKRSRDYDRVTNYLVKNSLLDAGVLDVFLNVLDSTWRMVDLLTIGDPSLLDHPSSKENLLPPKAAKKIEEYPFDDPEFALVRDAFTRILKKHQRVCLVYLDEFDKLSPPSPDHKGQVQEIFEGLVSAVYDLHATPSSGLCVKALIPHDRWVKIAQRDKDKFRFTHSRIRWTSEGLREFTRRRMALHRSYKIDTSFELMWEDTFPLWIDNRRYRVRENSFDYIMRHTLYRPRQLQFHLDRISKRIDGKSTDADEIPEIIRDSCENLVEDYLAEYALDHPILDRFLGFFRGASNVMKFKELQNRIAISLSKLKRDSADTNSKIDDLYTIGVIGYVEWMPEYQKYRGYIPAVVVDSKRYICNFYYKKSEKSVSSKLGPDDYICFHPMFFDYCRLIPHKSFLVG